MRKSLARTLILTAALGLAACAGGGEPPGTRFAQATQIPPVPPDRARFFFYRDYALYDSDQRPFITLNGQPVAVSEIGGVTFRDMPPGAYVISVPYSAIYPWKDKSVTVGAGQTVYVKIETEKYDPEAFANYQPDTFVVVLVDPAQAQTEIASKRYFP